MFLLTIFACVLLTADSNPITSDVVFCFKKSDQATKLHRYRTSTKKQPLTCILYDRRRLAWMPRGGSSVILTLLWSTPTGKYDTGAALKNSLKPGLECSEVLHIFLTMRSRVGSHEHARWQFCSITQLPFILATCHQACKTQRRIMC